MVRSSLSRIPFIQKQFLWFMPLLVFWLIGLLLGAFSARLTFESYCPYLKVSAAVSSLFPCILLAQGIPLILSAVVVHFRKLRFLYPIAVLKAFCFSLCAYSVRLCFGASGWLMELLLLFSDLCMLLPLNWLWLRCISGKGATFRRDILICLAVLTIVSVLDSLLISPFLASLFYHS